MTLKAFEEVKATLKDRWLDYYEANQVWIDPILINKKGEELKLMRNFLILGSITSIEPKLKEYLPLFCQLNTNSDDLVRVMGLDFNPANELYSRQGRRKRSEEAKAEESKKKAESANTCYKYQDELVQD